MPTPNPQLALLSLADLPTGVHACRPCRGTGRANTHAGGVELYRPCPVCHGECIEHDDTPTAGSDSVSDTDHPLGTIDPDRGRTHRAPVSAPHEVHMPRKTTAQSLPLDGEEIASNIRAQVLPDGRLVVVINTHAPGKLSASGKNITIATTGSAKPVGKGRLTLSYYEAPDVANIAQEAATLPGNTTDVLSAVRTAQAALVSEGFSTQDAASLAAQQFGLATTSN